MALTKCPACAKEISDKAASCPNCGHPLQKPVVKKRSLAGPVSGLVIVLIIVTLALLLRGPAPAPESPAVKACHSDWTKCTDNAELVNNYSDWFKAQGACKERANEEAKYGTPVWPWFSFGSFSKGTNYVTSGTAFVIEPDAQFQNAFGAMVHSRVVCSYDLRAQRVIGVLVSPR